MSIESEMRKASELRERFGGLTDPPIDEVSENAMLRSLCDSAQAWLDAAANLAPKHLKAAFIGNANEFRRVYAKITKP